ncbi:PepSY domain-containing protein [Piscibacillus halophilus]|uniref:Predicted small secreted protein n=1 Tax=Piscibacillus halophilus TaxID=571933 RepID=A0A1H9FGC6_9BACI|nr:PepSY domain-containing protein [Piscibacillus halophilus]SEQ36987.1 Predicted small secreted protein [Piscibacillus halophilus]
MKWYKLIAPAAIGITVGSIIGKKVKQQWLFPEIALKKVKKQFEEKGPITGSWILMKLEEIEIRQETYKVYRGGITQEINGQNIQTNFYIDASNGEILKTES